MRKEMSEAKLTGFFCTLGPSGQDNLVAIQLEKGDTNFRDRAEREFECKTLKCQVITNQVSTTQQVTV